MRTAGSSSGESRTTLGDHGENDAVLGEVLEDPVSSCEGTMVVRREADVVPVNGTKFCCCGGSGDAGKFGLYDIRGLDLRREKAVLGMVDLCVIPAEAVPVAE